MRACVDREMCIGCGLCAMAAEGVFEIEGGKAIVVADTTDENREDVMAAIEGCPVAAISEE